MSKLSSFLRKLSPEYRAIGQAMVPIALGIALDPKERANVQNVVDMVQNAADNIEASLDAVEKAEKAGVSKADIKKHLKEIVEEVLPDMLAGMIEKQMREALAGKESDKA